MDPRPVPPHVFGLDRQRLKYGRFENGDGGVRFGEFHSVELPEDCFGEGPLGGSLRDPAQFRERLGALLALLSSPVAEASLVLPDDWFRLAFAEIQELPRRDAEREEMLRFKLKLQVPFRVEDLRLTAREVPPLAAQEEARRVLMGFGIGQLLDQIEDAFEAEGIRLGSISSQSLSLLSALREALAAVDLAAVALISGSAYSLLIAARGEPVVHRFKRYQRELPRDAVRHFVLRDLRLTRTFLAEKMGSDAVERIVLIGPAEVEATWVAWLEEVFDSRPRRLAEEWPLLAEAASGVPAEELAPLFGAASREVA